MPYGSNTNDMWESLADAWIVTQKYREMIVKVVERQQEVKTKIKGTIELHKVWIISETPIRTSRRKIIGEDLKKTGFPM